MNKQEIQNLPNKTGIYKFLDKDGNLLYIGKALNLQNRVSSYFRDTHSDRPHIVKMIPKINKIEFIITENEVESVILEAALIKKYKPKFNIEFKDDKSFSWIYISTQNTFPTVKIVRSIKKDEFKKGKLFGPYPKGKTTKRVFDYIRKLFPFCTCTNPQKPCLYYHLDLCPAPYHNKISPQKYQENIKNIIKFLSGKNRNLIKKLKQNMVYEAERQNFEKAAQLRDKMEDLEYLSQKITISPFDSEREYAILKHQKIKDSLKILTKELKVKSLAKIECFDISNMQGKFAYGSMSVAINGILEKDKYRIYKLNSFSNPDDIQMMKEVMLRRLKYPEKPNLILIDGGITQLSALKKIIPKDIKILAISKGKRLKRVGQKQKDEFWIYQNGSFEKINIKESSILVALRDEAHRFALKYHRRAMIKQTRASFLDEIEGIGAKRKRELLKKFGNIENIKKATFEQLNKVIKNKTVVKSLMAHKYS